MKPPPCISRDELEQLYAQAYGHYGSARYAEARALFHSLLMLDSSQARFYKGAAACAQMLGEYRESVLWYGNALLRAPGDTSCLLHLARCFRALGMNQEAQEATSELMARTSKGNRNGQAFAARTNEKAQP